MRAVIQRVASASVTADGEPKDSIRRGLLVFLGVGEDDAPEDLDWLVRKVPQIRCFEDDEGRMNRSVVDIGGEVMVINPLFPALRSSPTAVSGLPPKANS